MSGGIVYIVKNIETGSVIAGFESYAEADLHAAKLNFKYQTNAYRLQAYKEFTDTLVPK